MAGVKILVMCVIGVMLVAGVDEAFPLAHRNLQTSTYSPSSPMEGDTIKVTASDGLTDQLYYVQFKNKCTNSSTHFACDAVSGQEQVLNSDTTVAMTHTGGGTYVASKTIDRPGEISLVIYKYTQHNIYVEFFPNTILSGASSYSTYYSVINENWGTGDVYPGRSDTVSARFQFKLRPPTTGSYVFVVLLDDIIVFTLNSNQIMNFGCCGWYSSSAISLTANQYYDGTIEFAEGGGGAILELYWEINGGARTIIPSSAFYAPVHVNSPKQVTIGCPGGRSKQMVSGRPDCVLTCGDGLKHPSEECDDGDTGGGDGCSSSCTIEGNYKCSGGTITNADSCSSCTGGTSPNPTKDACVVTCGDGRKHSSEECDDGNTTPGDGCSSSCKIETDYICTGGTTGSADTCTDCGGGVTPNAAKTSCVQTCGDGKKHTSEQCEDGNTSNGDGCNSSCNAETNYVCTDGTTTSIDHCFQCTGGTSQNSAKTTCAITCGDGLKHPTEQCDDGDTGGGDGCSASCTIETNHICTGGSISGSDTCTQCPGGTSPNSQKDTCEVICGDGFRGTGEECDDDDLGNNDGCSSTCRIEDMYICTGGSGSTKDTCTLCSSGTSPNAAKTSCVKTCGDGLKHADEQCDDGNLSNGDGCNSSCQIETMHICEGGSTTRPDTCTRCYNGYSPNAAKNTCTVQCGDGLLHPSEDCDDGDTSSGDGCSSSCTVETNYICNGGSTTTSDTCTQCSLWYSPNPTKSACIVTCGDGREFSSEQCDDGNLINNDGCNSECQVEDTWTCTGGGYGAADTCTQCTTGTSQNSNKDSCIQTCGDGHKHSTEECDDDNLTNGDGCSSTCTIEFDWICSLGEFISHDTCEFCENGLSPNVAKNKCVVVCGDSKRHPDEECDDGDTGSGDGCSSTCEIEDMYICTGGHPQNSDTCTLCTLGTSPNVGKTACEVQCGDGLKHSTEQCEDGNTIDGDGCSSTCQIEDMNICTGGTTSSTDTCTRCHSGQSPNTAKTSCSTICGDGLRHLSEQCDDQNTNNGDGCSSTCTIESGYVCKGGSDTSKDTCEFCQTGTVVNNQKTECNSICGDGIIINSEECDDGNSESGDGCNSSCSIEDNHICTSKTTGSVSSCVECSTNTEPNSDKNECVITGDGSNTQMTASEETEADGYSKAVSSASVGSAMASAGSTLTAGTSAQSMFSSVGHAQMMMVLPETGAYMPPMVHKTFDNLDNMMFTFEFVSLDSTPIHSSFDSAFGSPKHGSSRNLSVIDNGSSIINLLNYILVLMLILLFHSTMVLTKTILTSFQIENKFSKLIDRICKFMIFSCYIIFIKITYLLLCFVSFYELHSWFKGYEGKIISRLFALIIASLCFTIFGGSIYLWWKSEDDQIDETRINNKWNSLFSGFKDQKKYKIFGVVFFGRRLIMSIIVFLIADAPLMVKVSTIIILELVYLSSVLYQRPFEHLKDLIIEIVNEICYILLTSFLLFFNDSNDWNNYSKYTYLTIMLSNFLIIFVIGFVNLLVTLKRWKPNQKTRMTPIEKLQKSVVQTKQFFISNAPQKIHPRDTMEGIFSSPHKDHRPATNSTFKVSHSSSKSIESSQSSFHALKSIYLPSEYKSNYKTSFDQISEREEESENKETMRVEERKTPKRKYSRERETQNEKWEETLKQRKRKRKTITRSKKDPKSPTPKTPPPQ